MGRTTAEEPELARKMSCVDDVMATFYVQDSHAQCECGINLSDALKVCPSCNKTYKEAIEYWKDKQPKLKQVEADVATVNVRR